MIETSVPLGARIRLLFGGKSTLFGWIWIGLIAVWGIAMHTSSPDPSDDITPATDSTYRHMLLWSALGFAMMSWETYSGLRTLGLLRRRVALHARVAHAIRDGRITRLTLEYELPAGARREVKRAYRDAIGLHQATVLPVLVDADDPDQLRTAYDLPEGMTTLEGNLAHTSAGDWLHLIIPTPAFVLFATLTGYVIADYVS